MLVWLWLICVSDPMALNLDRAVTLTLEKNPLLQAIYEQRTQVEAGIGEAKSLAFPNVNLNAGYSQSRNPSLLNSKDFEDIVNAFPGSDFRPQTQVLHRLTVDVNQAVFTWGKVGAAIDLAEIVTYLVDAQIRTIELDVALQAANALFEWQDAASHLEIQQQEQILRQDALELVEVRLQLGEATQLEMLRAKSALAEVKPALTRARSQVKVTERNLKRILGLPMDQAIRIDLEAADPNPIPSFEQLMQTAWRLRPELAELNRQGDSLTKQVKIEQSDGKPQLEFNGSFGREVLYVENIDDPLYNSWSASLDFSWNLFDGGRRKSKMASLRSEIRQVDWQKEELKQRIAFEVEQNLARYTSAMDELEAARLLSSTAEEAERVAEASYREGVVLHNDWLDAQQQARRASIGVLDAVLEVKRRGAFLMRSIGMLPNGSWEQLMQEATP